MSIQTFTAAQVLTAAQMNTLQANDYNQTVSTKTASYTLVAADKGTRVVMNVASANTVTVNTSLFTAGDTLIIQNINAGVTTVTAGTATVSSAGPLTIAQYGSGTLYFTSAGVSLWFPSAGPAASSGLTLISSGTVSAGVTVSILNAFSTTYDFYTMRFSNIQTATNNTQFNMQLGSSGSADTGANYNSQGYLEAGGLSAVSVMNNAAFRISANQGLVRNNLILDISSPFLSTYTSFNSQSWTDFGTNGAAHQINGVLKTTTSYTDMFFNNGNADNIGPFTYALFGYAK
jgi:hypothetical protein